MIGQMKDQIIIQKAVRISNGRGGWTTQTETLGTFWAVVLPIRAGEISHFRQLDENINSQIFIRYDERVDTDCLIEYRGKTLKVVEVINPHFQQTFTQLLVAGGP